MAEEIGPGHIIVTILCDHRLRYQNKLFNPEFLCQNFYARIFRVKKSACFPMVGINHKEFINVTNT